MNSPLFFLRLLLIVLSFWLVAAWRVYGGEAVELFVDPGDIFILFLKALGLAFVFWLSSLMVADHSGVHFLQQFAVGTGFILVAWSLASYALIPLPLEIALYGAFGASALLSISHRWLEPRLWPSRDQVLFLGLEHAAGILPALFQPPLGALLPAGPGPTTSSSLPVLGTTADLAAVTRQFEPTRIIVAYKEWARTVPPSLLLRLRQSGIIVTNASLVYEQNLQRICSMACRPPDFLFQDLSSRRNAAIQAVYSNSIGLLLLVSCLPLMILLAILIRWQLGPGPTMVRTPCAGFQWIPFDLLTFRIRRLGSAKEEPLGAFLRRTGLDRLPSLINVIRGELAICGPRPARIEFSNCLSRHIPFYRARLITRPGFWSWASIQLPSRTRVRPELLETEYDLYYNRELTPFMDLFIILHSLLRCLPFIH